MTKTIILASTSPFRQSLLKKLNIPFITASPNIDETPINNEKPIELVERLAIEKAKAVAPLYSDALIIGSDQIATCDNQILGKPHTTANAIAQLQQFSGRKVVFYTGLCVVNSKENTSFSLVEPYNVHFRKLTTPQIQRYIDLEQPLNCAGSFKSEGLGITLFEKLEGNDPNSLIGLPLIQLVNLLSKHGFNVLEHQEY